MGCLKLLRHFTGLPKKKKKKRKKKEEGEPNRVALRSSLGGCLAVGRQLCVAGV
jgi:hypothetical protein